MKTMNRSLASRFAIGLAAAGSVVSSFALPPFDYTTRIAPTGAVRGSLTSVVTADTAGHSIGNTGNRDRALVALDWSLLDTLKVGDRLALDDLNNGVLEVLIESREAHAMDSETFFGQIAGVPLSDCMIVRVEDTIFAQFRDYAADRYIEIRSTAAGDYEIRKLAADVGDFCQMVKNDPDAVPAAAYPGYGPIGDEPIGDDPDAAFEDAFGDGATQAEWVRTIDVLGVYTPAARQASGGGNAMRALFQACVNDMNVRLSNSLVHARVRLVWTDEMDGYNEDGCRELTRLKTANDGYLEEARSLRELHNADVVVLIMEAEMSGYDGETDTCTGSICGVAPLLQQSCTSQNCVDFGYAVLGRNCNLVGRTFAHEVGHILGACHETDDGGGGCDNSFPHPYGKRFSCDLGICDQYFIDTMAYGRSGCSENVILPYYSHRDLSYNPSESDCQFCGTCPSRSIGDADTHFAAGTIYFYTRDIVAFFKNENGTKFSLSGFSGPAEGTALQPYPTFAQAAAWLTPYGTVVLYPGTYDEVGGLTTFDKPMTVTSWSGMSVIR